MTPQVLLACRDSLKSLEVSGAPETGALGLAGLDGTALIVRENSTFRQAHLE